MFIDAERFADWAEDRFGDIVIKGDEVRIHSPFVSDNKHHCWCNLSGYTKKGEERPYGIFHCFKTDQKGSLVSLVMLIDKCDYGEALETLGASGDAKQALIEKRLEEFFEHKYYLPKSQVQEPEKPKKLQLPPFTYPIDELASSNYHRVQAEVYLLSRKLPTDGLMVCTMGKYQNRIIIPYYDVKGELIYYNGRYIGAKKTLRYLGPDREEVKVGKDDVLYFPQWPTKRVKVYLTEGELDALSIFHSGRRFGRLIFTAAFGGKNLSDRQIGILRLYRPVLCLDTDIPGKRALRGMAEKLRSLGVAPRFVRPPKAHKDWNKMLEKVGPKVLLFYIFHNEQELTDRHLITLY